MLGTYLAGALVVHQMAKKTADGNPESFRADVSQNLARPNVVATMTLQIAEGPGRCR